MLLIQVLFSCRSTPYSPLCANHSTDIKFHVHRGKGLQSGEGDVASYVDKIFGIIDSNTRMVHSSDAVLGSFDIDLIIDEIVGDFAMFAEHRPEYYFGAHIPIEASDVTANIHAHDVLFAGAMLVRAGHDDCILQIEKVLKWLHSTDFYIMPSSTIYHDSFPGGNLFHILSVANRMYDLLQTTAFSMVNTCDAIITALTHDWCKIYMYEQYSRNVKNEITKKWEEVPAFRHRDKSTLPVDIALLLALGHGAASVELARRYVRLTPQQMAAIRWHMGRWNTCDSEFNDLQFCNTNEPMCHLLQFADQLAIVNY